MTVPTQENQEVQTKTNDKEVNFRMLEAKYQRELEKERQARLEIERQVQELRSKKPEPEEEEDDEPYVDRKKLQKTLNRFGEQTMQQTQNEIQKAVHMALAEERKQNWIKNNPDFGQVLQHADKLYEVDPELAETILQMPEGFERQKLVYKNIKALRLHEPPRKEEAPIQKKINANQSAGYYQPSGVGHAPTTMSGDFSAAGQKAAFEKLQELKKRMRL